MRAHMVIGPVPPERYTCRHCGGPIRIARWRKRGWKHTNGFATCVEPYPVRPLTQAEPKGGGMPELTWGEPEIAPDRIAIHHGDLTREDIVFLRALYARTIADDEWVMFPSGWWLTGAELRRDRTDGPRWIAWREKP